MLIRIRDLLAQHENRISMVLLVLLSFVGAFLLLSITAVNSLWDGALEMTPDSVQYVAAAQNILAGNDYMRYEGSAYVSWPPLYSTIIAALYALTRAITPDVIHSLRYFHVLLYIFLIFSAGLLFFRYVKSRVIGLFGVLAALTGPVLYVSHLVWSEEIFVFLVLLFLLAAGRLIDTPTPRWLIITALLAMLAPLQRYAGITIVATGGIIILTLLYQLSLWQRVKYAAVFGVIAMPPILLWMLRNYLQTGRPVGTRSPAVRSLQEHIATTWQFLQDWYIPHDPAPLGILIALLILGVFSVAAVQRYRSRQETNVLAKLKHVIPLPVAIFVVIYVVFLNITLSISNQGAISLQYLMPVHIPILILLCALVDNVAQRPWGKFWVTPLVALWVVFYAAPSTLAEVHRLSQYCCPTAWRNSEIIDWLQENDLPDPVYANTPLSQYRGIVVRDLPRRLHQLTQSESPLIYSMPENEAVYVVWYNYLQHDTCPRCYMHMYSFEEFSALFNLEPFVELGDGTIYRLTPKRNETA